MTYMTYSGVVKLDALRMELPYCVIMGVFCCEYSLICFLAFIFFLSFLVKNCSDVEFVRILYGINVAFVYYTLLVVRSSVDELPIWVSLSYYF